jgi:hypothetical protein
MGAGNARWIWGDIDRGPGERTNGSGERTLDMGDINRGPGERVSPETLGSELRFSAKNEGLTPPIAFEITTHRAASPCMN